MDSSPHIDQTGREAPGADSLSSLLSDAPTNWGRWGPDDEVGALNFLADNEVVRAAALVRSGRTFTLQMTMAHPDGDPVFPGRIPAKRYKVLDKSDYRTEAGLDLPGGVEYADDVIVANLQGSTQIDALGHVWIDETLWNRFPAESTIGHLRRASITPIAQRGIVGAATLLDFPRLLGVSALEAEHGLGLDDVFACQLGQGVEVQPRDVLMIRTGWLSPLSTRQSVEGYREPGLRYSPELVQWFHEMQIPVLCTDTLGNELVPDPATGFSATLHCALMRNLGVVFNEANDLEDLAADCAQDRRYRFMYVAAPLNVFGAAGAPVNPVAIK